ncbi:hypothetical protein RQN30_02405 [Arcanobacterium hippocoleae]
MLLVAGLLVSVFLRVVWCLSCFVWCGVWWVLVFVLVVVVFSIIFGWFCVVFLGGKRAGG